MEGLFRRRSGVYVARLVVPARLRGIVGKREFIASTRSRSLAVARIVAGALLLEWRRRIATLSNVDMDVLQIAAGSPSLQAAGHISLRDAAAASGIDEDQLLREAGEGGIQLFIRSLRSPATCCRWRRCIPIYSLLEA